MGRPFGSVHEVPAKDCRACGVEFQPKPNGNLALYCSPRCKTKMRTWRVSGKRAPYDPEARRKDFQRTMADPALAEKHRESSRVSRIKIRAWLASYKTERGCVDCGFDAHFAALQLDHEGEKTAEISNIRTSVKRLQAEIDSGKCVVRCANCHSIKTWAERNGHSNPTGKCHEGDGCA